MPLEAWDSVEAAGGARQAVFARDDVLGASFSRALDTATARFRVARDAAAYASVTVGGVLRTALLDGTWDEWIVVTVSEARTPEGAITAEVECEDPSYLLSWGTPKIERIEGGRPDMDFQLNGLTPDQWVDIILETPGWPSWIVKGTIEPTDPITIPVDLLSARRLIAEIEAKANSGAGAEFRLRRNLDQDYRIDILDQRGSDASTAFLSNLKNIRRLEHSSTIKDAVNRVYPVGGGPRGTRLDMSQHRWEASVSASDVALTDPQGLTIDVVAFDDQLNGLFLEKADGSTTEITDSVAATDIVTVADATGVDGTLVRIVRNAAGDGLTYLEDPTSVAEHGLTAGFLDRQDIAHANNLVTDPYVAEWTGDSPDNLTAIGSPTITRNTDRQWTTKGGDSAKIVAADGEGVKLKLDIPIAPTSSSPTFVGMAGFFAESLDPDTAIKFQVEDVTNGTFIPEDASEAAESTVTGPFEFTTLSIRKRDFQGTTSVNLHLTADGGGATFYADAFLLVQQATVPEEFVRGRGANRLYSAAQEALKSRSEPVERFTINVLDLFRTDPSTFEFDELVVGGTVRAKDEGLGLDRNFRIVQVDSDLLTAGDTDLRLAEQPRDITRILSARDRIAALGLPDFAPDSLNDLFGSVDGGQLTDGSVVASKLVESAQGFGSDIVFSATDFNTVAWTAGTITLASGTSFSIGANDTGDMTGFTYIYLDPDVSTTQLQATTSAAAVAGDRKVLLAVANPAGAVDQDAFFVPAIGVLGLNEDNLSANITATNILKANTITAPLINVAQLSAISADVGTLTAGAIRDIASRFNIDLDAQLIYMLDEDGVTRVRLGRLGAGEEDWGEEIYDSEGNLIIGIDGLGTNLVGPVQIQKKTIPLEMLKATLIPATLAAEDNYFWLGAVANYAGATSTMILPDQSLFVTPVMPATDVAISELVAEVITGSSNANLRLVIYEDNAGFYPGDKVFEGAIDVTAGVGLHQDTGLTDTLVGGRVYWAGTGGGSNILEVTSFTSAVLQPSLGSSSNDPSVAPDLVGYQASFSPETGAAPDTFPASATAVAEVPALKARRSTAVPAGGGSTGGSGGAGSVPLQAPVITHAAADSHEKVTIRLLDQSTDEASFELAECSGSGCTASTVVATQSSDSQGETGDVYTFTRTGRTEDTTYRYRAHATNGATGDWSIPETVLTKLHAPSGLSVSATGTSGELALSWTVNSGAATSQRIRYREVGVATWSQTTVSSGATSHALTGLNAVQHEVQLRAEKSGNQSLWTASKFGTSSGTASTAPELNSVTWDAVNGRFDISWVDNAGDETGYQVWRVQGSGNPFTSGSSIAGTLAANTQSFSDSGPSANSGQWTYGIRKKGGAGGDEDSGTITAVAGLLVM